MVFNIQLHSGSHEQLHTQHRSVTIICKTQMPHSIDGKDDSAYKTCFFVDQIVCIGVKSLEDYASGKSPTVYTLTATEFYNNFIFYIFYNNFLKLNSCFLHNSNFKTTSTEASLKTKI